MFWYNPPWSINVRTNVERKFLHLIDKHFKKGVIRRTVGNPPGAKEGVEWARHFNRSPNLQGFSLMPQEPGIKTGSSQQQGPKWKS